MSAAPDARMDGRMYSSVCRSREGTNDTQVAEERVVGASGVSNYTYVNNYSVGPNGRRSSAATDLCGSHDGKKH